MESSNVGKNKAIASLVLGIVGIVLAWFTWLALIGLAASIIGIVMAVGAKKVLPAQNSGMATAGMVCSIIGLVLCAIVFLVFLACHSTAASVGLIL